MAERIDAQRPLAAEVADHHPAAPLRAGLRLKREPRPSVCGEVAPAQAASLCSDADTNFPEPTPCSHVTNLLSARSTTLEPQIQSPPVAIRFLRLA